MRQSYLKLLGASVIGVGLVVCAPALGQQDPPAADAAQEANRHREQGTRYYNVQDFIAAAEEYRLAYQLDPRPDLLYAVGQAERLAGNCERANLAYSAFLATTPGQVQAETARKHIEHCEALLTERKNPRPFAPARRPPKKWYRDAFGVTLAAVGLAGLVVGPALWGAGARQMSELNSATTYQQYADRAVDSGLYHDEQVAGIAVTAVSGALFIIGAARLGHAARVYHKARERGEVGPETSWLPGSRPVAMAKGSDR